MAKESEIFNFEPLIGGIEQVDFHIASIRALFEMSKARGYFVICHKSTIKCIVNMNPCDPILPCNLLGRSLSDLWKSDPGFEKQNSELVSVVGNNVIDKMPWKKVSVNYEDNKLDFELRFGTLPNMPEKWGVCRIGVIK